MNLSDSDETPAADGGGSGGRRIPRWAAGLLQRLARDRPAVVTREDLAGYLRELGLSRGVELTVRELRRLGWLVPLHIQGAWAYLAPGEDAIADPYADLRGWQAADAAAVFALAGEAAAWHLGYLGRVFAGPVRLWVPDDGTLPYGLRSRVSVIRLGWSTADAPRLLPSTGLLHRRRLDVTGWAAGLPGFGPEALAVQLSMRPASFRVWADLVPNLGQLAGDCDTGRLLGLLAGRPVSVWQRAAYLMQCGDAADKAGQVIAGRPGAALLAVQFGSGAKGRWVKEFGIMDHLIAPIAGQLEGA